MTNLHVLDGVAHEVDEPIWETLIPNAGKAQRGNNQVWRDIAGREWRRLVSALRSAGTLAPENRHQMQRLVLAYVRYDRASAEVFKAGGPITKSKTGVPMLNQWQVEMRQADSDATTAEMELGIPPRRRGAVAKAKLKQPTRSKADEYLGKPARPV
jgi:P27 family predicted phage terminase small subunit